MEKKLNNLYRKIAETVNQMIPEEWDNFYFYAQVSDTGGGTYFYYKPKSYNKYIYSLEIPRLYKVNEKEFKALKRGLFPFAEEMREVFKENNQELWYSFTMYLESTGKLKIHFDYTNWFETEYGFSDQMIIWKYKYLNEKPKDEKLQKIIDSYLVNYPDNPI
ncbi:antitoxin YezG family protein [Listeria seeligeri]|uniref:antitoxin YezG family protein n=1 Tax=Listeria seeligeri TaxID=1640 RepID=UPI001625BD6D|nr:antitoxin YezG family protein [Listeria seeligeri]MBC1725040.1 antitoxin YezG family protein [Listeria seeligeri]MBC1735619.1 antitoxin YezG family protein [Listeria seeligeri]MBC1738683.1 antitoxin YezG family protein [Listeria seeligeri]MBF2366698.1 antitoxin YezG family protein [Listeria seeligeri]MBF2384883.1 antitoxin YezG family protein [Listeria seeligeri]